MDPWPEEKKLSVPSFATHSARGIIRDPVGRRRVMLGLLGVALVLVVLGSTVLRGALDPRQHLLWFCGYWLACAWVTISALLLALFDLLMVRAQARAARQRFAEELLREKQAAAEKR